MNQKLNTVLLTGAAGFIGSVTAKKLLNMGTKVIGIDNLNEYYDPSLKKHRLSVLKENFSNFEFYNLDILKQDQVEELILKNKVEAVINLAAMAGVRFSIIKPELYFDTNLIGTLRLLELCKKHSIKKFILASTSSLYSGQKMPFTEVLPVNEPLSPYAASKKSAEVLCYTYHKLFSIDVSILRFFTVYGPAGRPDMSYFRFIRAISEGTPITLYGDGTQGRDFTYVEDIAEGVVLSLKPLGYEIINLGGGNEPISINTMINELELLVGKKALIDQKKFHGADMKNTWAEISKAKNILNWTPKTKFKDGLKKSVDWYNENEDWIVQLNSFSEEG